MRISFCESQNQIDICQELTSAKLAVPVFVACVPCTAQNWSKLDNLIQFPHKGATICHAVLLVYASLARLVFICTLVEIVFENLCRFSISCLTGLSKCLIVGSPQAGIVETLKTDETQ